MSLQNHIAYTRSQLSRLLPKVSVVLSQCKLDNLHQAVAARNLMMAMYYEDLPQDTKQKYDYVWNLLRRLTNLYQQQMAHAV